MVPAEPPLDSFPRVRPRDFLDETTRPGNSIRFDTTNGTLNMNDYEIERLHDASWGQGTPAEACREYAFNAGADCPDRPWILTDYDVWMPNPHFVGDRGPHPED